MALFSQHITQANEGCDFDFLERGAPTPSPTSTYGPERPENAAGAGAPAWVSQ